jgi:ABC-type microcin C transport system permease subunit YejE
MKRLLNLLSWMRLDQQVGWPAKLRVVILTILLELAAGAVIGYGLAIWSGVVSLVIGAFLGALAFWVALVGAGLVFLAEVRAWHVFRLTVLLVATAITSQLWWILHFPWF